jgi:hypothetical protein
VTLMVYWSQIFIEEFLDRKHTAKHPADGGGMFFY